MNVPGGFNPAPRFLKWMYPEGTSAELADTFGYFRDTIFALPTQRRWRSYHQHMTVPGCDFDTEVDAPIRDQLLQARAFFGHPTCIVLRDDDGIEVGLQHTATKLFGDEKLRAVRVALSVHVQIDATHRTTERAAPGSA